jgi:sigma-B regulation protein RsbU (phosphoserine phosphatase)
VLLIAGIVLLFLPSSRVQWQDSGGNVQVALFDGHVWGGLLILILLFLEVADRVVMKRDLQIAKEIQAWLLPSNPPSVPGMEIAFATRPANTVAGDFYDVFCRTSSDSADRPYMFAIADVAGKSIPASLLMATFQASLKTLAGTTESLTELVGRMNAYACTNSQQGRRFTTALIAEYDPVAQHMVYVNAGHNLPVVLRTSGAIERMEAGGIPLGVLEDAPYASGSLSLASGDWVVLFTDGVVEAENIQELEYGEPRFLQALQANARVSAAQMLHLIMTDLDRFVGQAPQHDDVTLLILKKT